MTKQTEIERIKKVYAERKDTVDPAIYSVFNAASLFIRQSRERAMLDLLRKVDITSVSDKKILEVGCGTGEELRNFVRYGAMPGNCFGIDLLPERIERACAISPNINFRCANAEKLPYAATFFDIILFFTVFTSIFDPAMKQNIIKEALRVLKPDGIIVYYDFSFNNPKNRNVRGIKKGEIRELFRDCTIYLKRITVAPPLARAIAPYSHFTCYLLEKLRVFNSHYLGLIRRRQE